MGISLVCRPEYSIETVEVKGRQELFSDLSLTLGKVIDSQPVEKQRRTLENDPTKDLPTYFSTTLNHSEFSGEIHQLSEGYLLDYLSIMMLANSTPLTFQTAADMAQVASNAFSQVFSLFATRATDNNRGTTLMQPVKLSQHIVDSHELIQVVFIDTFALKVATAILVIYCLSVLLLYPGNERRTVADVSNVGDVLAMIYDSSLISRSYNQDGEYDESSIRNTRFTYGVFQGTSGERRLGIEVVDEVEEIKLESPWRQMSRWFGKIGRAKRPQSEQQPMKPGLQGGD